MTADYDPKSKKHSPVKAVIKMAAIVLCCVGVVIAIQMQKVLVEKDKAQKELKKAAATVVERVETQPEPENRVRTL